MKKLFLSLILVTFCLALSAQDTQEQPKKKEKVPPKVREPLLNKKGKSVLPEAKDWSIGFDANFIIDYVGNLFNNSTSNPGGRPDYLVPNTIVAKYMKNDYTAYIASLRLGNVASSISSPIPDQQSTVSPAFFTTDTWKNDSLNLSLGFGIQKFRGKGRLQGVYGGQVLVSYASKTDTYTYGNPIDATHPVDADSSSTTWNTTHFGPGISEIDNIISTARVTKSKGGAMLGIGVRGFLGIEYFFATKMSLGAQYGWGIAFVSQGNSEATVEYLDSFSQKASTTVKGPDMSSFYIDVDNASGQISLNFYF